MSRNELKHIAFIMDGNGRYAKSIGLPRHLGHKKGCENLIPIYEECYKKGIKVMSLYAFSTENWSRPKREINHLFNYLKIFFKKELKRLIKDETKIIVSGDISLLPIKTQEVINDAIDKTKDFNKFIFNICLNYGGQAEIIRACKLIAEEYKNNKINIENIDTKLFDNHLYTKDLPPVDLLIRTGGDQRISNYLLWQLAYSELMFVKTPWPIFSKEELDECIDKFYGVERRFGGLINEEK